LSIFYWWIIHIPKDSRLSIVSNFFQWRAIDRKHFCEFDCYRLQISINSNRQLISTESIDFWHWFLSTDYTWIMSIKMFLNYYQCLKFGANCNVQHYILTTLCHMVHYNLLAFFSQLFSRLNSVTGKHAMAVTNLSYKIYPKHIICLICYNLHYFTSKNFTIVWS